MKMNGKIKASWRGSLIGIGVLVTALVVVHNPAQIKMIRGEKEDGRSFSFKRYSAVADIVVRPNTRFVTTGAAKKRESGLTSMEQAVFSLSLTS